MQAALWILAALTTAIAGYLTYRADVRRTVPKPWLTALLRSLVIALVWLLLLAPSVHINKEETQQPVVVFLQDESASIPASLKGDTAAYRQQAQQLINKLKDKYRVVTWGFGGDVQPDSLFRYRQSATDISAALSRAQEFFGQQNLGAVILASDGRFNQGVHPLFQNLSLHSPLYTIAIGDTTTVKDLRISRVYANRTAAVNSQFEIRADILANGAAGYNNNIQLLEASNTLQSTPVNISADRFDHSVSFTVKASTPGLHHYVMLLPAAEGEINTANNRRDVFVEVVEEKKNILILTAAPHPDVNAIREALTELETYNVTVRTADASLSLNDYQVIILYGLPGNGFNQSLAGKPVWYILSRTTMPGLATTAATLQVNPAAQNDIYAGINPSFSAFTIPARVNAVMDKLPPLSVAQGNIQPGANTQALFYQRTVSNNSSLPLWLVQTGSTPQAILAGEGLWRWRLYEYRYFHNHDVVDELIRQTVSLLAANAHENPFRAELSKYDWSDGENVTFNAYLLNATNEQVNTPEATLSIKDSSGKVQSFTFERNGSAYRLSTGIQAGGTYTYTARTIYNGKTYSSSGSFVVSGTPLEFTETGADYPLLYSLAKKYNGDVVLSSQTQRLYDQIASNEQIRPLIHTNEESLPLVDWKWYFFLILLIATAEWLLRKYWLAQ